ncbi:Uncharacterised protein [Streptococcus pneumoniae]|nr:Uncharacterised protein [Streptococcus pneumoniae]
MICGNDDGIIIRVIVCHFVAPSPRLASFTLEGTSEIAFSQTRVKPGKFKIVKARAPPITVYPQPVIVTNTNKPNKPTTIEGKDAIVSIHKRTKFKKRPCFAYSAKYIPAPNPRGIDIISVITSI